MGTLIFVAILVAAIYGIVKLAQKGKQPKGITCPKCKTLNTFDPIPCENCSSTQTRVERQYSNEAVPYIQRCFTCKTVSAVSTQCKSGCGTDLRGLIGGGAMGAALKGAQNAQKFNNNLRK